MLPSSLVLRRVIVDAAVEDASRLQGKLWGKLRAYYKKARALAVEERA